MRASASRACNYDPHTRASTAPRTYMLTPHHTQPPPYRLHSGARDTGQLHAAKPRRRIRNFRHAHMVVRGRSIPINPAPCPVASVLRARTAASYSEDTLRRGVSHARGPHLANIINGVQLEVVGVARHLLERKHLHATSHVSQYPCFGPRTSLCSFPSIHPAFLSRHAPVAHQPRGTHEALLRPSHHAAVPH